MRFSNQTRKNFVIFSLVLMLGLIGYVNYNLNKQSLLQTSSELEKYELTMMEESGILSELLEEESVFNDNENENEKEKEKLEEIKKTEEENEKKIEEQNKEEATAKEKEIDNAVIVDSRGSSEVSELVETASRQIENAITNKKAMKSSTYFIESKLERDKKRSEMVSSLNDIISNQMTSEDVREQALGMKLDTIANTEKEVFIENMIMAKGFNDVIVYLTDESINVVVNSDSLNENDVAKIVDIVKRETDIAMDNIIIMSKK